MGQEQNPFSKVRAKAGDEVSEVEGVSGGRHVSKLLHLGGIGSRLQMGEYPVAGASMRFRIWNPVPEVHLCLDVRQRHGAIELQRGLTTAATRQEQPNRHRSREILHHRT